MSEATSATVDRRLLAELWDRFDEDPGWIPGECEAITEAIHRELPQLGGDPDVRELTYRSTEAVVRLSAQLLHSSAGPDEARSPPAAIEYARELVHRDVSIDTLLRTYQIGNRVWYERFASRARATLDSPEEVAGALEQAATWTLALLAVHSRGLVAHYGEERERWVRSAVAWRAEAVRAILAGEPLDASAEPRLGYALSGDHVGFVLWSAGAEVARLEDAASRFAASLGPGRPLLHPLGGGAIAGWVGAPRAPAGSGASLDGDLLGAVGTDQRGAEGFARSHREALRARRVAELLGAPPGSVTAYRDVALEALALADREQAREFVTAELGPLCLDDESWRRLATTLQAYLAHNARIRPTAQALGVHENTVKNRIQAAAAAVGRPVESRPAELLLALRLARLGERAKGAT